MLSKRTNILFDEKTWDSLVILANQKKMSVGELVRIAVIDVYLQADVLALKNRKKAEGTIKEIKKNIKHKFSSNEIKDLINYGRKV